MDSKTTMALAGNPNCGKTTLFNDLTGSNGYVGNWPGVTVEKHEAAWRKDKSVFICDLPGIYSLSAYSPEEEVSKDYLIQTPPDVLVNLVDASHLERNLYLTTQLLDCSVPMVVGLNMADILEARGVRIDLKLLSERLGCPCLEISALRGSGIDELMATAEEQVRSSAVPNSDGIYSPATSQALGRIQEMISDRVPDRTLRWHAIKLFERDGQVMETMDLSESELEQLEGIIRAVELEKDDDSEAIITAERYMWISDVVEDCVTKLIRPLTVTEKIDKVVTSRFLGIPIFIAIMSFVYFVATSSVGLGTSATNWVNDNLFGDGWFTSQESQMKYERAHELWLEQDYPDQIDAFVSVAARKGVQEKGVVQAAKAVEKTDIQKDVLKSFASKAKAKDVTVEVPIKDKDGNFLDVNGDVVKSTGLGKLNRPDLSAGQKLKTVLVTPERFLEACYAPQPEPADFGNWVDGIPVLATNALEGAGASPMVVSLMVDGIIAGVGSVLGFLPQMLVLFMFLSFLEDCGYMSRVAFVMDRVFRKFGLSGKSFIPMLISTGCAVPAIMSTKTIENENDRRMTIMTVPFIPCSAKLPIIALLMGALAGGEGGWWVAPMFYFLGVAAVIISGIMLKKTKEFAGDPTPFIMELPEYHLPSPKSWALHVGERIRSFVTKASTIIFLASITVWFLGNFGFASWEGGGRGFGYLVSAPNAPEDFIDFSLLAGLGNGISWIFAPLGFGNWKAAAATLTGFIAKENLVSTYSILFNLGELSEGSTQLWSAVREMFTNAQGMHAGSIISFMTFNMLCAPCFAAMGAMRKQMDSSGWWWRAVLYETGFAWVVALIINQSYELIAFGNLGFWTIVAIILLCLMAYQLARPVPSGKALE